MRGFPRHSLISQRLSREANGLVLARRFAVTHDAKVREEIERLARNYGKLGEPWVFVAK
jgi:hypothetical protein